MSTKTTPPLRDYQLAAIERIRAMPVQFFWPPSPPKMIVRVAVIAAFTPAAK